MRFEIFVSPGFNALEVAAVSSVLEKANHVLSKDVFDWRFVSDTPGLLMGSQRMIVRAQPAVLTMIFQMP